MTDANAESKGSTDGGDGAGAASASKAADPIGQGSSAKAPRRRTRTPRTYPAASFVESLPVAEAIQRFAAGQRIRRLTLFENMGRSADSGHSRQLVTNSNQYGLTTGSYQAEYLELTPDGKLASGEEYLGRARLQARLELAIGRIEPFKALYDKYGGDRLPSMTVLRDVAIESGTASDNADECVQTFLANARDLGLARNIAGAERLLTFDHVLEEIDEGVQIDPDRPVEDAIQQAQLPGAQLRVVSPPIQLAEADDQLADTCFLISPIGSEGSEQRRHANLVLGSLLEPALDSLGMKLVRADKISQPGMITAQVIEYIAKAPLVVADLSFGNPNVFYELALRHACRKPAVQLIRASDHLPFDVGQFRTVVLDMTDIYSLVPQIDSYRAEIARQCRAAIETEGQAESPLSLFYPSFWDHLQLP